MDRKDFIRKAGMLGAVGPLAGKAHAFSQKPKQRNNPQKDREYWVQTVERIARPVLEALSKEQLKATMPVETRPDSDSDRTPFTHLEAFGRLMTGIAPWLELGKDDTPEGRIRAEYIDLARASLTNSVDPSSADFMNFNKGKQPLVDAAFLAHALIKAPEELWNKSSDKTRQDIVKALKSSRDIVPYYSNWILFSAMVEAALMKFDAGADKVVMDLAIRAVEDWYLGDGIYGDGPDFHWDYYNSYVIQPFMLTILEVMSEHDKGYRDHYQRALKISQRYAEILQRLIMPDGSFPIIGRSVTYRYGAFQLLAQVAWMDKLVEPLTPASVRGSLTRVFRKVTEAPGTFDENGWLTLGVYGHQPHLAEFYISTGSLYLCASAFLPLGLKPQHDFWSAEEEPSIEEKIWSGKDAEADHHLSL